MKALIISFLIIINISFLSEAQTSLKITNGVLKVNENTAINISSDLIIESSAYLKNDGFVELNGHFRNSGEQNTIVYSSPAVLGQIKFSGSSEQSVLGNTETILEDVFVNNSHSNGLALSKGIQVFGTVNFKDGHVNSSNSNLIHFRSGSSVGQVSDISFVDGPVKKSGNTGFVFPIGKSGVYRQVSIVSISGNESFTAEYFDSDYGDTTVAGASIETIQTPSQYWTVDRDGLETAGVSLSWNASAMVDLERFDDLIVARFSGSDWNSGGGNNHTGNHLSGTVSSKAGLSSFGDFTLALAPEVGSLPVELVAFNTDCHQELGVNIEWATVSERNSDYFTVQKSKDGYSWEDLSEITSFGNSNSYNQYEYHDKQTSSNQVYYRLMQTDFNGLSEVFKVSSIACDSDISSLSIYPNPTTDFIHLKFNAFKDDNKLYTLNVYNSAGQLSFSKQVSGDYGTQKVEIPSSLISGVYLVQVIDNAEFVFTEKLKVLR